MEPGLDRSERELDAGDYGDLNEFKSANEQQHFQFAEGLPGMAWENQGHYRILVLTFRR